MGYRGGFSVKHIAAIWTGFEMFWADWVSWGWHFDRM